MNREQSHSPNNLFKLDFHIYLFNKKFHLLLMLLKIVQALIKNLQKIISKLLVFNFIAHICTYIVIVIYIYKKTNCFLNISKFQSK